MKTTLYIWVCFGLCTGKIAAEKQVVSLSKTGVGRNEYILNDGVANDSIVWGSFDDHISSTGWSYLEIHGNKSATSHDMAYYAGLLEGKLTADLIDKQYRNTLIDYCSNKTDYCGKLSVFLERNLQFMIRAIGEMEDDPFWFQVNLYMNQLDGLRDGYKLSKFPEIPDVGFWYFQITGDFDDLEAALGNGNVKQPAVKSDSCSAIIKLLPNYQDVYVSHDTWGEYQTMLRIYKLYDLPYATSASVSESVVGSIQSFSSYPGELYSGDDFYEISSGLVTLETTNGNYNNELLRYISPHKVFEGIRTMVANRLASNGSEWCEQFSQYNSGTYNNQWMVVDYKQIKPGVEPVNGTLWVLEQLPDLVHHKDVTDVLISQGYWASYNVPYFDDIFEKSGFSKLADQYGSFFTHAGSPRAKIFARDQNKVTDINSLIHLMRYNDFKHDPLSACNCTPPYSAENAICARSDLNDVNGTYPFFFLSHRLHGGTDTKVTSSEMFHNNLSCIAISGPTHQQQPPFQWSTSGYSRIPDGHPDLWKFEPVKITWTL